MKRRRAQLVLAVAIAAIASCLVAAAGSAATSRVTVRLYAKAGPVKMHADLTMTVTHAQAVAGSASTCTGAAAAAGPPNPRSGLPTRAKLTCTPHAAGTVKVPAATTSATFSYKLRSSSPMPALGLKTSVEIRHQQFVLFKTTSTAGTFTIPAGHSAALLNGHDTLNVTIGAHTYSGKIVEVK